MNKGFSLIVLIVVVAIVLVLATTATVSVVSYLNSVNKMEFALEIARVQSKVDVYHKNNNRYPTKELEGIVTIDISGFNAEQTEQFSGETVENDKVALNYINMDLIFNNEGNYTDELHSLKYGNKTRSTNDVYLVSKETGKVYYLASYKGYYTLTEELKNLIEYSDTKDLGTSYGIIFSKSTDEYTNLPISVEVKIPQQYIVIECKLVTSSGVTSNLSQDGIINDYAIYKNVDEIREKSNVIVKWRNLDYSETISTFYTLDNFDFNAPEIQVVGNKQTITNNVSGEVKCMYYLDYSDSESGIDIAKYAEHKVISDDETDDDKNMEVVSKYFESNGKSITGNNVEFDPGVRWLTIYVKDKAGNENYIYKQVPEKEKTATVEYDSIYEE